MSAPELSAEERAVSLDDPEFTPLPRPPRPPGTTGPRPSRIVERDVPYEIDDDGCFLFTGRLKSSEDYGVLHLYGHSHHAHRAVWLDTVGQIPPGMHLDHLCRKPACINPDHMEVVTPRENILRGEGPSAHCARRTHCGNGHELIEANTDIAPRGERICRVCKPAKVYRADCPHGTDSRYRAGCRCDECRTAAAVRRRTARTKRRLAAGKEPWMRQHERPHGTRAKYRSGCRCELCRGAERAYKETLR